jgi:hypothetical protein
MSDLHLQQHEFMDDAGQFVRHAARLCWQHDLRVATGAWWRVTGDGVHANRLALDLVVKEYLATWRPVGDRHVIWPMLGVYWKRLRSGNAWGAATRIFPEGDSAHRHDPAHFFSARRGT